MLSCVLKLFPDIFRARDLNQEQLNSEEKSDLEKLLLMFLVQISAWGEQFHLVRDMRGSRGT